MSETVIIGAYVSKQGEVITSGQHVSFRTQPRSSGLKAGVFDKDWKFPGQVWS